MTKELNNPISIIARSGQKARGVQHLKKISGIPSFLRRDLSKNPDASGFFIVGECRAKAQSAQRKTEIFGELWTQDFRPAVFCALGGFA